MSDIAPRMKLLIETTTRRVLFAEASKDAIDVLSSLLDTPVDPLPGLVRNESTFRLVTSLHELDYTTGAATGPSVQEQYMVMDDLTIKLATPMSAISTIRMLRDLYGVSNLAALEERTVPLGFAEGVTIIAVSMLSQEVLTDVYLTM